jgi:Transposase and inactivated derivatives, IS30 family
MCLLNYNKEKGKYKHITYEERTMIERWYNRDKKRTKEIAELLEKSERTIRREVKRGIVIVKGYEWEDIEEYSAMISQDKYDYNKTDKGPGMKLDQDIKLVKHIEKEIVENKKSPEVVVIELKNNGFDIEITGRTIRNAIKQGTMFNKIKPNKIIYKKEYKNKNEEKRVSKMIPAEKSIEHRPQEVNNRSEYGHWEGDLVIGKKGTKAVLFTLTERKTREEIIFKVANKENINICRSLDKLERKLGKSFYRKFKSITFDNGAEFQSYEAIEKSCLRKTKRTSIYYAHPYCSGERGSNENNNRMIRRWIPKGTIISNLTNKFIKFIEDWLNNYPRAMFDYKSSNMILSNI